MAAHITLNPTAPIIPLTGYRNTRRKPQVHQPPLSASSSWSSLFAAAMRVCDRYGLPGGTTVQNESALPECSHYNKSQTGETMSSLRLTKSNSRTIEEYAQRTGKTTSAVVNEAINFWFELNGEIALEELDRGVPPERRLIDHPLFS